MYEFKKHPVAVLVVQSKKMTCAMYVTVAYVHVRHVRRGQKELPCDVERVGSCCVDSSSPCPCGQGPRGRANISSSAHQEPSEHHHHQEHGRKGRGRRRTDTNKQRPNTHTQQKHNTNSKLKRKHHHKNTNTKRRTNNFVHQSLGRNLDHAIPLVFWALAFNPELVRAERLVHETLFPPDRVQLGEIWQTQGQIWTDTHTARQSHARTLAHRHTGTQTRTQTRTQTHRHDSRTSPVKFEICFSGGVCR